MARSRLLVVAVLATVALGLSALLLLQHHGEPLARGAVEQACGPAGQSGCDAVARSGWSTVAGWPLAALGIVFYGGLAALALLGATSDDQTRLDVGTAAFLAVALSLAVDLVLLGVQAVSIRAFCTLCVATYVVGGMALAVLWTAPRQPSRLAGLGAGQGRLVATGTALTTIALLGGAWSADAALAARARSRGDAILGSPAAGGASGDARSAEERAQRLQETLDDPRKLEQYFADKALREFDAPPKTLRLDATPAKGPADAPLKVVEYSDFLCPFCRSLAAAFSGYLPQSGGRVSIHYKNYPLETACNPRLHSTVHPGACLLALGAICAHEQGKFWPYHDRVFAEPPSAPKVPDVVKIAGLAGLDTAAFGTCLESATAREKLAAEIAEAQAVGVSATPTVFINGRRLSRLNDFVPMLDREAGRLGLPATPPPPPAPARDPHGH